MYCKISARLQVHTYTLWDGSDTNLCVLQKRGGTELNEKMLNIFIEKKLSQLFVNAPSAAVLFCYGQWQALRGLLGTSQGLPSTEAKAVCS